MWTVRQRNAGASEPEHGRVFLWLLPIPELPFHASYEGAAEQSELARLATYRRENEKRPRRAMRRGRSRNSKLVCDYLGVMSGLAFATTATGTFGLSSKSA